MMMTVAVLTPTFPVPTITREFPKGSPFVKRVGGKRSIMSKLLQYIPAYFGNYYEPFVGGGSLFFELHPQLKKAYLSDINFDLMITYKVIQKNPKELIASLKKHQEHHGEAYYYQVRAQGDLQAPVEIASRFIYMNKTCYNGLYRVNSKGGFNVPMGNYKNPNIVQEENLLLCHQALKKAKLRYQSFGKITPEAGDFVYFDPPYHPTQEHSFTKYDKL